MSNKRIRNPLEDDEEETLTLCNDANVDKLKKHHLLPDSNSLERSKSLAKKPREHLSMSLTDLNDVSSSCNDNEFDSDDDYDDLIDDFGIPNDMDDYLDDGAEDEDVDDDQSTTSTRTTMSTGSVGSNTPSVVGENLESFCLGEAGATDKQVRKKYCTCENETYKKDHLITCRMHSKKP
jgi:hypothetical protein